MSVLRAHRDSIIAVLEAFVYDPLLNWRLMDSMYSYYLLQIVFLVSISVRYWRAESQVRHGFRMITIPLYYSVLCSLNSLCEMYMLIQMYGTIISVHAL